ncbi:MAG: membrane dipeptidase [Burkholderiaceae bacterium]
MADMHSHFGMWGLRLPGFNLVTRMRESNTTLLAWSVTDDWRWITPGQNGWTQHRIPAPGELWEAFQKRYETYDLRLKEWQGTKALTAADVDAALAGEPRVLMATEGANFLEGQPERLAVVHGWGVRHVQLVHFIQSPLGDHQTAEPKHGGLTPTGVKVVQECARLGIVVDLAHGTGNLVDGMLDASGGIPVWSHSWISPSGGNWTDPGYIARSLSPAHAKKIAARGGVVGLWTVNVRFGYPVTNARQYADEIIRMCELIGPAHVAFGTDMEGAGRNPILNNYVDLRAVADDLLRRGLPGDDLRGVLIGNYARAVKAAMNNAKP